MTPQEQQLVADLFDRLASLEGQRRDPDAERLIREGLGRAPNAIYALCNRCWSGRGPQRASARIEELERAAGGAEPPERRRCFSTTCAASSWDAIRRAVPYRRSDRAAKARAACGARGPKRPSPAHIRRAARWRRPQVAA